MGKRKRPPLREPCAGRRGCERSEHMARGLCEVCYKSFRRRQQLHRFPRTRQVTTSRQRYEEWVASGLSPSEYAAYVGISRTSLSRALKLERERLKRHGASYLDGYRRLQVI